MTLLPVDSWNVRGRPDIVAYEINDVCAAPGSNEPATENHHLWRRSFSPEMRDSWWVELPDGTIIPNRVGLSTAAHREVTENRVRIAFDDSDLLFYWIPVYGGDAQHKAREALDPQPGPQGRALQFRIGDYPIEHDDDVKTSHDHDGIPAGKECPTCHRRVPHPRLPSSPKTKTFAYRVPVEELEAHEEVLQAAAEKLGIDEGKHVLFKVVTVGAALILQADAKDLP